MKVELLKDNAVLVTCKCGQTHRINFYFKDGNGADIADLLDSPMSIDGETT
jgi:hypothetical protein